MPPIARASLSIALALGLFAARPAVAAPAEFQLDPRHTSITFFTHHLGFADIAGMFLRSSGSFSYDEAAQALANVRIVVQTDSVFSNDEERDGHLKGADFLNSEEFPEMVFTATRAEKLSENTAKLHGELTLIGVTKPMTLDIRLNKAGRYPFLDEHYAIGLDATGSIKRSDFGMTYGVDGGWVGDEIRFVIGFEAIRQE